VSPPLVGVSREEKGEKGEETVSMAFSQKKVVDLEF
jgi:hypothetical protein